MVTIELDGIDDLDQFQLIVTGRDLPELLPYLRLADLHGVRVAMLPATTEESQTARALHCNLQRATSPGALVVFIMACLAIEDTHDPGRLLNPLLNQAIGDARESHAAN